MTYRIEAIPMINFLTDNKLKLPRFQRKATWDEKQNFELCISVFQEYPIGVVIVNEEKRSSWLLDGRQRRNALKMMRDNPVELYKWARAYLKFNKTADVNEVKKAFWSKVDSYLSSDISDDVEEEDVDDSYYDEKTFDQKRQQEGLQVLLDLILMVHQINAKGVSSWETTFDFTKYISRLKYASGGKVNPQELKKYLINYLANEGVDPFTLTQEEFFNYFVKEYDIPEKESFEKRVQKNWKEILNSLQVIEREREILDRARIGVINLTRATPLDAQNIFSRINRGGTQLKAEELLSAKPYWNEVINVDESSEVAGLIKDLYKKLGIPFSGEYVRWDLPATLLQRIDHRHLIFDSFKNDKEKNNGLSMNEIILGFKLISSIFVGGMANTHVTKMETTPSLDALWKETCDSVVEKVNGLCDILFEDELFNYFHSFKMPLSKMLGNAVALEFVCVLLKSWENKGQTNKDKSTLKREAKILLDRLIFEYATKLWRGSGDSKMAQDLVNWQNRLVRVEEKEWIGFIQESLRGEYRGSQTTQTILTPVLCYSYALNKQRFDSTSELNVDHIIPKAKIDGNQMVEQKLRDSLSNLAFLPQHDNVVKKDQALNEIKNSWLKGQITEFEYINERDFDKFSDISNFEELIKLRGEKFNHIFTKMRMSALSN